MKTGIATLLSRTAGTAKPASRVHGLVMPNDESSKSLGNDPAAAAAAGPRKPAPPAAGQNR
jgi:lipopolysaccharide export system protein LptA